MTIAMFSIMGSVVMHVVWNLLVRQQGPQTRMLWWALATHCVLLGPWGVYALITEAHWSLSLVGYLATSALANMFYFIALDRAYHHAPVALVYPIVRSSPLLIGLWSVWFFHEILDSNAWVAMGVSVGGLLLLASTAWRNDARAALPWAFGASLMTSVYSLSDKAATEYLPSIASLLGFITVGYFLSFITITILLRREHGQWFPRRRPPLGIMLIGGLCIGLAYIFVIHAMRSLPAAVVVAFTNSGIVIAGLLSIFMFHERAHWQLRLVGILITALGLVFLVLTKF